MLVVDGWVAVSQPDVEYDYYYSPESIRHHCDFGSHRYWDVGNYCRVFWMTTRPGIIYSKRMVVVDVVVVVVHDACSYYYR